MKIVKSYNNNIVLAEKNERQVVVVGSGIGFAKKTGDFIDHDKIETIFNFSDSELELLNLEVLKSFSLDEVIVIRELVEQLEEKYQRKFNSSMVVSLIDHIRNSIEHPVQIDEHPMRWVVKRINANEYDMSKWFVSELDKSQLNITLPHYEITSIALHLMNNQNPTSMQRTYDELEEINKIINIIEYKTTEPLERKSIHYSRFIIHLKYLLNRLNGMPEVYESGFNHLYHSIYQNSSTKIQKLSETIAEYLNGRYTNKVDEAEKTYLLIYLNKLISH